MGLGRLAAAVPREHAIEVLDLRLEDENALAERLRSFQPDLVGTTSMTTDAYQAKAVLRMARSICPDALTVVGGHHPTLCPQEFETERGRFWSGVQSALVRYRQPRAIRPDGARPRSILHEVALTAWDGSSLARQLSDGLTLARARFRPTLGELRSELAEAG